MGVRRDPMDSPGSVRGLVFVVLSAVIFGCTPVMAKAIYQNGGNAVMLAFCRNLFSSPVLYLLMRRQSGSDWMIRRPQIGDLLTLTAGFAGTPLLLYLSYNHIPSGMATTIHFIYPVFVLLACILLYREPPDPVKIACVACCVLGVALFYTPGSRGSLSGILLAFLSGVTFSVYVVGVDKSRLRGMAPFQMGFFLSLAASAVLLAAALLGGFWTVRLTPRGWALTVLFSMLISVVASVLFQIGIKSVGPQRASILSTFEPLTSILMGVAVFQEAFTPRIAAGTACILAAVVVLTRYGNSKA